MTAVLPLPDVFPAGVGRLFDDGEMHFQRHHHRKQIVHRHVFRMIFYRRDPLLGQPDTSTELGLRPVSGLAQALEQWAQFTGKVDPEFETLI